MAIARYLAMTAGEMADCDTLPPLSAWMACHFSSYSTGLSNLPRWLPPDSLLILNDSTPIHDHDPVLIAAQLENCAQQLGCSGILLDFQRPGQAQTAELTRYLCQLLSLPVVVSEAYAEFSEGAVFLPPPPLDEDLAHHLSAWQGRELWLEIALDGLEIVLREQGAAATALPFREHPETGGFGEPKLHCHYCSAIWEDSAVFTLWRSPADVDDLLSEVEGLGVTTAVGLYQEFCSFSP